jgi:hypothetical protein
MILNLTNINDGNSNHSLWQVHKYRGGSRSFLVIVCSLVEGNVMRTDFALFAYLLLFGDPDLKRGCWNPIERLNPSIFVYLSQAMIWISIVDVG